jgi:hypothetical protein
MIGGGSLIVNVKGADIPPPGVGLDTVITAVPAALTSAAVIAARKVILETKVVARAVPFHCTVEDDTKFVPVTVNVKPGSPANAEFGFSETAVGAGLLTVKVNEPEVPPPGTGLDTLTMFVPPVARSAEVMAACNVVLETKVVVRAPAFHCTVDVGTKFVPVTVSVNAGPPATAEVVFKDAIVGAGLLVVNANPLDVPPPGVGLDTVTIAVPPEAISPAGIAACKLVLETKVVVRAPAFHCTVDVGTKFVPVTVRVNAPPPAMAEFVLKDAIVGAGLLVVNANPLDVPPPGVGLDTVTIAVPAVAMSAAVIAACRLVLETNLVVRAVPFHCTVEGDMKFVPVTVSVNAPPPAMVEFALKDVIVGAGSVIVNGNPLDMPPPGVGLETVTIPVPPAATSAAVMAACKLVLETNVVVRPLPLNSTVEDATKFAPVTVSVKPCAPATTELGLREPVARDGVGLVLDGGRTGVCVPELTPRHPKRHPTTATSNAACAARCAQRLRPTRASIFSTTGCGHTIAQLLIIPPLRWPIVAVPDGVAQATSNAKIPTSFFFVTGP